MMIDPRIGSWAATMLRIALGVMLIAYNLLLKFPQLTLADTPGLAYAVFAVGLFGGLMLILGIQARWFAALLAGIVLGETWGHWDNIWLLHPDGGGWEYPVYLFVLCLAQGLLGDGRLALSRSRLPRLARGERHFVRAS